MNMPFTLDVPRPHYLRPVSAPLTHPLPATLPQPAPALSVLVVDDEASCREELADALERRGLVVLTANSAAAALGVLRGRADIGAMVTDVRMPGTDGLALAERALAGRPGAAALEVVLVSGYVAPGQSLAATRIGACSLVPKPVRGAEFGRLVEDALARAAARRAAARAGLEEAPPAARTPAQAAEALLGTLAERLDGGTQAVARMARDLRAPLAALLGGRRGEIAPAGAAPDGRDEVRRLLRLVDELLEAAALEDGTLPAQAMPVSAHALAGAVAGRLSALGIACGRRIMLQPDADPAFRVDLTRLGRAVGLLGGAALRAAAGGPAVAELSLDAGAGEARIELSIRPVTPGPQDDEARPERALPVAIARRLMAADGARLEAWLLPHGALRARILLPAG
jgi:CheY-like chemotaxis protein